MTLGIFHWWGSLISMYVFLQMNECSFSSNADNASVKRHLWQYPVLELVPQFSSSNDCTSVFPPEACSTETHLGFIMKCCSVSQSHYSRSDTVSVWQPGKATVGYTRTRSMKCFCWWFEKQIRETVASWYLEALSNFLRPHIQCAVFKTSRRT